MTRNVWPIVSSPIEHESDVVAVRQRARRLAELLGFEAQDQTRIATAVSEIARNAYDYARGGRAEFGFDGEARPQEFVVRISDKGSGIHDLDAVLEGRYRSSTGLGLGIVGARRLMDRLDVVSAPGAGATVLLGKAKPRQAEPLPRSALAAIADRLARERDHEDPLSGMREQNRELIRSLDELRERQEELRRLNRELEDTNRGVVALYAELDDKAAQLRQASELKSRFLSNMSHEFRTPLSSILALARLLLDRVDGPLTGEQERQVTYILRAAGGLAELVNDLLDLARVEAGKAELRPVEFTVPELFSALRGALKPLRTSDSVELVFEDAGHLPPLFADEGKVAQVLRNFISNALKFTEHGEVRVTAGRDAAGSVVFAVRDTGIGIAPEDQERIFEDFAQVDNRIQARVKGTGLGLPLSRGLADLMGGKVWLESAPGAGSAFFLSLPPRPGLSEAAEDLGARPAEDGIKRVLVIDDEEASRYVLRQLIACGRAALPYDVAEASGGEEGLRRARESRPDVIVLDLQMPGLDGYAVLRALAADPATRDTPVIVSTASAITPEALRRLTGVVAVLSKQELSRESLESALRRATEAWTHA